MKKWTAYICAVTMAASLSGCAGGEENTAAPLENDNDTAGLTEWAVEGEITVSYYDAVYYKDFLENAAKAFEEKYPGTKIRIEASSQMPSVKTSESEEGKMVSIEAEEDSQGQSDYINKVNTALMSGGGADIFAMDVIPYYKYAENGQLEDLQPYMDGDPDFNITDYKSNIINAVQYKNGQYIFPLDYTFQYYEYDSALLNDLSLNSFHAATPFTVESLMETAGALYETNGGAASGVIGVKGYMNPVVGTSMFHELFMDNYRSFVDIENREANFTDGTFAGLLDAVMAWEEKGYIQSSGSEAVSLEDFSVSTDAQYYYKLKSNIELLLGHLRVLEGWQISIPVAGVTPSATGNDAVAGISAGKDGAVRFAYSQAYGMNANSNNKQLAWTFIKFLASQEIQETLQLYPASLTGLPVHNEARLVKARDGITGELFMQSGESAAGKELTDRQQQALDAYISAVEDFSDMLSIYPVQDVTINAIIHGEVQNFFEGRASAEDTAEAIQSKVAMYLNE